MKFLNIVYFLIATTISQGVWAQSKSMSDGEITSLEWNIIGMLEVSYAVGKSGQSIKVDCTVFNEDKKPVGGGFSYTSGGVAQMSIKVPSKLQNTNSVTVTCVPTR